jgi:DNA-binding transcriptional LysR family regulator
LASVARCAGQLEFERAERLSEAVAPPAPTSGTISHADGKLAACGVGFGLTFEGYVDEDVKSGALVSVLEDWCAPFPGPFLYYPSRRQRPPALEAFVEFVAARRKRERTKEV